MHADDICTLASSPTTLETQTSLEIGMLDIYGHIMISCSMCHLSSYYNIIFLGKSLMRNHNNN